MDTPDDAQGSGVLEVDAEEGDLPSVGRERVLEACLVSCTALSMGGVAAREGVSFAVAKGVPLLADTHALALFGGDGGLAVSVAAGLAAAAVVTAARQAVKAASPEYAEASRRSLKQVLSPLGASETAVIAVLPAFSEELLFRGALLPAVGCNAGGVLVAAAVFGALHAGNGGRNAQFAAFAGLAGAAYGAAALATGGVTAAAVGHGAANLAEALAWRSDNAADRPATQDE